MYLVVDSGTTNTRVRLWHEGAVLQSWMEPVGARDTARDGSSDALKAALKRMIAAVDADVEAVICSGMITSNVGLFEVPHVTAPVNIPDLARAIVRQDFPEISQLPFYFIPGIKTLGALADLDVLRGEEVQCVGLRSALDLHGPATFVSCGSHHKLIQMNADGIFLGSRTALTGELLSAVRDHTLIGDSLDDLNDFDLDDDLWRAGVAQGLQQGFARALFVIRAGQLNADYTPSQLTSFFMGVLVSQDIAMLGDLDQQFVLYGQPLFCQLLRDYLPSSVLVDPDAADKATVNGAVELFLRGKS